MDGTDDQETKKQEKLAANKKECISETLIPNVLKEHKNIGK